MKIYEYRVKRMTGAALLREFVKESKKKRKTKKLMVLYKELKARGFDKAPKKRK